jgi:hypothetical protein
MNYGETIYLTNPDTFSLSGISPFTLVIEPSGISPSSKIYKIEYYYDDEIATQTLFPSNSSNYINLNLPIPEEPGDPRNYKQIKKIYIDQPYQTLVITIKTYQFTSFQPSTYTINLSLSAPSLEDITGLNGYFKEIHLKNTRMFGINNELIYIFESESPNYLLPVCVNWKPVPQKEPEQKVNNIRSYRLLAPYENENATSIDLASHIGTVGEERAPDTIDLG